MNTTITLKPGLLVSIRTRNEGGVKYARLDLAKEETASAATVEKWETTKTVFDKEEHEKASKLASKLGNRIRSVCAFSEFGYLCRADREKELDEAIVSAREEASTFNETSKTCRVSVFALKGRIAESDAEAARAVGTDLLDLIREMEKGVEGMSVKDIRDAASKAKKLITMVDDTTAKMVEAAVEQAREIATELRKNLDKGERGANEAREVVKNANMSAITKAREALDVVDLDQPEERPVAAVAAEAVDLDLGDDGVIVEKRGVEEVGGEERAAASGGTFGYEF